MADPPQHAPRAWALGGAGALAVAAVLLGPARALLDPPWPAALAAAALGALTLVGAAGANTLRARLAPLAAALRLTVVLLLAASWRGDAREIWGALAVWTAWRDAEGGLVGARPLAPAAVALCITLAWSAYHGGPAAGRSVLVALIAAAAAARGHRSLRTLLAAVEQRADTDEHRHVRGR